MSSKSAVAAADWSAISMISSLTSGDRESVQHRFGRSAAPGSMNRKNKRALAVAKLL